jgi:hypothetical protein
MRTRVRRRATLKLTTLLVAQDHLYGERPAIAHQIRRRTGQSPKHPPGINDDEH